MVSPGGGLEVSAEHLRDLRLLPPFSGVLRWFRLAANSGVTGWESCDD